MKHLNRRIPLTNQTPYICHHCRKTQPLRLPRNFPVPRSYSSTTNAPSRGCVLLKSRRLIHISGADSTHYLQGAITANVDALITQRSPGFYAAFLNAQGRILNDVFIYPLSPTPNFGRNYAGYLIEVDADEAEKLVRHIKKYKLRAKFQVRMVEEGEKSVWFSWDDSSPPRDSSSSSEEYGTPFSTIIYRDTRAPNFGHRLILSAHNSPTTALELELAIIPELDETSYKIRRYLHGIPEGQKEILRESALVQESNIDYMGGVDYRKGCYVGQELTIRTHHTGVVRKRILPMMLYPEGEDVPETLEYKGDIADGSKIEQGTSIGKVGKKGRSAGKWLAGVGNLGLGLVRLEVMTGINVQGEVGGYKEGDEFRIDTGEGGDEVRVKAFVPSWHLNR